VLRTGCNDRKSCGKEEWHGIERHRKLRSVTSGSQVGAPAVTYAGMQPFHGWQVSETSIERNGDEGQVSSGVESHLHLLGCI